MKKIFFLITLIFIFPAEAFANPLGITASPAVSSIRTQPGRTETATLNLENKTDQTISYVITMVPFKGGGLDGEPILVNPDSSYQKLFSGIYILENGSPTKNVSLGPRQKKSISLVLDLPGNLEEKDYYFSVIFTSESNDKPEDSTSVSIDQAIGINVLLSVGAISSPSGDIKELITSKFVDKGPINLDLVVKNSSQNFTTARGNVLIVNMFGQDVGSIELEKTNILANSERLISANWKEEFLLGKYKAIAEVALSAEGPVITKEITFYAFPTKSLILVVGALFMTYYLKKRLEKK